MVPSQRDKEFAHKVLEQGTLVSFLEFGEDISTKVDSYFFAQLWEETHTRFQQLQAFLIHCNSHEGENK